MKDKGNDKKRENKTANKIVPMYDIMADVTEIVNSDGSSTFRFGKGIPDYYDFGVLSVAIWLRRVLKVGR